MKKKVKTKPSAVNGGFTIVGVAEFVVKYIVAALKNKMRSRLASTVIKWLKDFDNHRICNVKQDPFYFYIILHCSKVLIVLILKRESFSFI